MDGSLDSFMQEENHKDINQQYTEHGRQNLWGKKKGKKGAVLQEVYGQAGQHFCGGFSFNTICNQPKELHL